MRIHEEWLLTAARAALHLPTGTAEVADLHLGYAEARHRGGEAVPRAGLPGLLEPLRAVLQRNQTRRLVIAGDLFEAGPVPELTRELLSWLKEAGFELAGVVPGNHDRGLDDAALPVCREGVVLGRWQIVHGDGILPEGAVVHGHDHPCLRWGGTKAECYLVAPDRLVLPAFSADAAGVNVLGQPRWAAWNCAVIAGEQVLDFGLVGDLPKRLRRA
jgi:metallophosphoesterase superfamily enzyme